MAIFSMYTGALYNEFFSMAMSAFGPQRFACATNHTLNNPVAIHFDHESCPSAFVNGLEFVGGDGPYPAGVDPGWKGSTTELSFLNSVKMKMSILLGMWCFWVGGCFVVGGGVFCWVGVLLVGVCFIG